MKSLMVNRFDTALTRQIFTLLFLSMTLLGSFSAAARDSMHEPNWSLAMARSAAGQVETRPTLKLLFQLAREGNEEQLLGELSDVGDRSDWPVPAREKVLHAFALGLGDLRAWTVSQGVIDALASYQPKTLVAHPDRPEAGVPLFNIRAAATGSANQWRRRTAEHRAKALLEEDAQAWLDAYLAATSPERKGYLDALYSSPRGQLTKLGRLSLENISADRSLSAVAAQSAVLLPDPLLFREVISASRGPGLPAALRAASAVFSDGENLALLEYSIRLAPPRNAALAIALLAPSRLDQAEMTELMFGLLGDEKLGSAAALVLSKSEYPEIQQRLALLSAEKDTLASKRATLALRTGKQAKAGDSR